MDSCGDKVVEKFKEIIEKIADKKDFFFVQIGSHIGGTENDHLYKCIRKYDWSGILVEPVPHLYEKLKKNYEWASKLTFENVAISENEGLMKFYSIRKEKSFRKKLNQLSSFSKKHILKHPRVNRKNFDSIFREDYIKTITFSSLIEGVSNIDVLNIDTEGYDFEIIKSIDFHKISPSLILYESQHLKNPTEVVDYLNNHGYQCFTNQVDTLAIHKEYDIYM